MADVLNCTKRTKPPRLWVGSPASFARRIDFILINFGGPSWRAVGLVVVAFE
jgi:hypothetical protein